MPGPRPMAISAARPAATAASLGKRPTWSAHSGPRENRRPCSARSASPGTCFGVSGGGRLGMPIVPRRLTPLLRPMTKPDHQLPKTPPGGPRAFFGRRSGKKLHGGQQAVFDATLPALEIKLAGALDPHALFPDADRIVIEIGYGGGEHLALEAGGPSPPPPF